jgi:tetratricopeptide (TPR) repeat protein
MPDPSPRLLSEAFYRRAVETDPTNADHHTTLGVFLSCAGRLNEAVACYHRALRLRPSCAVAYNNLGYAYFLMGRYEEARACSERALLLRPDFVESKNHLGLALLELGQPEQAATHFREALRLRPHFVEARHNLGSALEQLGQQAEAMACYGETLRLRPDFAEGHITVGDAFKKQGRFREAMASYEEALRLNPACALGYWNLAQFAAQGLCRFSDEHIRNMQSLLESGRLSSLDRSILHLTLGNLLDQQGAWDNAFSHYRHGNALRKEWLQHTGRAYDPAAHRTSIDRLIAAFDEPLFRQGRKVGNESELPVFVVGMPRSGTTLVEQILSSHSQVVGAGELQDLEQLLTTLAQRGDRPGGYPACLRFASDAELHQLADQYVGRLARLGGAAVRVIDKMPANFLLLGAIARVFPRARVIHCCRDPLDVCLSCYFQNFKDVSYAWSLEDLGHFYREYERLMAHWQRVLPLRVFDVRYEDLVVRQEAVSRDLVAFCGLEWEDRCLAFHKNPRPVGTLSAVQVRRPLFATSIGRWKKYAAHLQPLRRALDLGFPSLVATSDHLVVSFGTDEARSEK